MLSFDEIQKWAKLAKAAGYFAGSAKAPAATEVQIAMLIATGDALGLHPAVACQQLQMVKGKVTISAAGMLGFAVRAGITVEWTEDTATAVSLRLTRAGKHYDSRFTVEMAKTAGVWSSMYQQFPGNMLRARAVSNGVRAFCPDVLGGATIYTPEEVRDMKDDGPLPQAEPEAHAWTAPEEVHGFKLADLLRFSEAKGWPDGWETRRDTFEKYSAGAAKNADKVVAWLAANPIDREPGMEG